MKRTITSVVLAMGAVLRPDAAAGADLPDFVVSDLAVAPTPPRLRNQDVVFVGVTISNQGADSSDEIVATCSFTCRGNSRRYIGGMVLKDGLGAGQSAVVGDRLPIDLGGCYFDARRDFECVVDVGDKVREQDEANNVLSKVLLTGR